MPAVCSTTGITSAKIGAVPRAGPKSASPTRTVPAIAPAAGPLKVALASPNLSTFGTAAVTRGPVHTSPSRLMADAARSALVMSFHSLPVTVPSRKRSHTDGKPPFWAPLEPLVKVWKPRPWPISCSSTVMKSMFVPWLWSRPR